MKRAVRSAVLGCALTLAVQARGQARPAGPGGPPWASASPTGTTSVALSGPGSLLGHFGADAAARLMRSNDAQDRLRGIERASATHTPEGLMLLERAARARSGEGGLDPRMPADGIARSDPRALLAVVRGLSEWDNDRARAALLAVVAAPTDAFATRVASAVSLDPAADEAEGAERVTLARREAAIALAATGGESALEALVATARSGGAGQAAALEALSIHPPAAPLALGGVALTTPPVIALATRIGDLRSLDPILGVLRASDPALRATAIASLGDAGDTRGIGVARSALHDPDLRVRLAAGEALARLGAPDAEAAIEALIADDATAGDALVFAQNVQGEGVTKSAAARAVASADPEIRAAAVATLGRQTSAAAVHALIALIGDPLLRGDAAYALARSPNPEALRAIEGLAITRPAGDRQVAESLEALRRLAARAYLARRFLYGDRSARLEALIGALAASSDPRDRAVGVQALVALGERPIDAALADRDPRVRRAAAMGAMGRWDARTAERLLARAAVESDGPTRWLLALGLMDRGGSYAVPSSALIARSIAGGPDAPLATFALAERDDDTLKERVDALLSARDPLLRAHAALGLGGSREPDATGRLARAYAWEGDEAVRRAIVSALAMRNASASRSAALALAARLDPDSVARWTAAKALASPSRVERSGTRRISEIAWMRVVPAEGATSPTDMAGLLVRSDGFAVPIVFDDEGFALVPGVPPGEAQLRLAPALPAYSPPGS